MPKKELSVGEAYEYLEVNREGATVLDSTGKEWSWDESDSRPVILGHEAMVFSRRRAPFVVKPVPLTDEQIIAHFERMSKEHLNLPGSENFYRGSVYEFCADVLRTRSLP